MSLLGFTFARIEGESMQPMLPPGCPALFRRPLFRALQVARGDVVLVDHPDFGIIVKRAVAIGDDDQVALEGLSLVSTSPEKLGSVSKRLVLGVFVRRLT